MRDLINVMWVISDEDPDHPSLPDWPEELSNVTGANEEAIKEYFPVILSPEVKPGTAYTYGNRLKAYPTASGSLDQVKDVIIKRLKEYPDGHGSVATTMVPEVDSVSKNPPCLSLIQCLQTDGALHLLVTFRSHDIFKAAIANAFALRKLHQEIAAELEMKLGSLAINSQSAHIYEDDWTNAQRLTACVFMEREPDAVFHAENADPRGNLTITLKPDKGLINVVLLGSDGAELWQYEAPSARQIQAKIGQLDLLSNIGHAVDVGMELQKAQLALDHHLVYTQDRPLVF
jgi:thymidylate synthase